MRTDFLWIQHECSTDRSVTADWAPSEVERQVSEEDGHGPAGAVVVVDCAATGGRVRPSTGGDQQGPDGSRPPRPVRWRCHVDDHGRRGSHPPGRLRMYQSRRRPAKPGTMTEPDPTRQCRVRLDLPTGRSKEAHSRSSAGRSASSTTGSGPPPDPQRSDSRFVTVDEATVGEPPAVAVRGLSPGFAGGDGLRDPFMELREGMSLQKGPDVGTLRGSYGVDVDAEAGHIRVHAAAVVERFWSDPRGSEDDGSAVVPGQEP